MVEAFACHANADIAFVRNMVIQTTSTPVGLSVGIEILVPKVVLSTRQHIPRLFYRRIRANISALAVMQQWLFGPIFDGFW